MTDKALVLKSSKISFPMLLFVVFFLTLNFLSTNRLGKVFGYSAILLAKMRGSLAALACHRVWPNAACSYEGTKVSKAF